MGSIWTTMVEGEGEQAECELSGGRSNVSCLHDVLYQMVPAATKSRTVL